MLKTPRFRNKRTSLSDDVVDAITDGILSGDFCPGQRLKETDIAKWLGVSRTPVREALNKLERQTLLQKDASRSHVVANWTKKDLIEIASLRSYLESLVIELIVPKISVNDHDYLEMVIAEMENALKRENLERLFELDIKFHSYLWQITDHTRLLRLFQDIKVQIYFFMRITRPGDEFDYPETHRILIGALKKGDVARAKLEMENHILSTANRAIARIDERHFGTGLGESKKHYQGQKIISQTQLPRSIT
ncbi:MAG: GntR family transcriptional regulator [Anaerolineales bacterium]|nr:GntR family transcriptional regulator [Anaerolineales bacterium]